MTDLEKLYTQTRLNDKCGHHAALRAVALSTGLDEATIDRCLKRAKRADALEARSAS